MIRWSAPTSPNGILLYYHIERRLQSGTLIERINTLNISSQTNFIYSDQDNTFLMPFIQVEYRIAVENSAGTLTSGFASVLTLQAGKYNS